MKVAFARAPARGELAAGFEAATWPPVPCDLVTYSKPLGGRGELPAG